MKPLTYKVATEKSGQDIHVRAEPNQWAAKPDGWIFPKGPLNSKTTIRVNWSCGGMEFGIEEARSFFRAGLEVCRQLEKAGRKAGVIPPSPLSPRGDK